MEWLNYHHLLYFWVVAKEGSISRASKRLRLAHPTISAQIHQLEDQLGSKLFERQGRGLVLTEFGRVALSYSEEIFALGREFMETAKGLPTGRPLRLVVGVSDALPKSTVYRILAPIFRLEHEVHLIAREDKSAEAFVAELAMHGVDVVLSETPAGTGSPVRAFSHLLGECGTAFLAAPELADTYSDGFPTSLDGAPVLLPGSNSPLRRDLEQWFDALGVRPRIVAEIEDPGLTKVFAEAKMGILAVPEVIEAEVVEHYQVRRVGHAAELRQRFYAISLERKIKHPAVAAICASPRADLFS